ncbi:MAG: dephospho-CoA kinase [Roseivirga sp.]|nr:dephospho-CoA kinase [Roseivirga sp.]
MNKPILVGLTGGIGSGKTTVSRMFKSLGVPVYYADDRGKWLMVSDQQLKSQIIEAFGKESYDSEAGLNRAYLAQRVFSNDEELLRLNELVHPAVGRDFEVWVQQYADKSYLIKEAALIFEGGSYKHLDKIITVSATKDERVHRVLLRDLQRSREQVLAIMEKQLSENERKRRSDYIIDNNGKKLVIPQVLKIDEELRGL